MKRKLFLLIFLCLTALSHAKTYTYKSVPNDAMGTRIYRLDNGLTVYLSVNKEKPRLQANIAVKTGSRNDPKETTGLAHYLEHLMFKGTKSFGTTNYALEEVELNKIEALYEKYRLMRDPAERKACYHLIDSISQVAAKYFIPNEYDKLMSQINSHGTNAYTYLDETVYVEDLPNNEIEQWAKVQSDRFQNMVIRGFHTELEAVYEEYNIGLADDQSKTGDALLRKLFPQHPYGTQTVIGTQDHLKNPSITNIKNYFNKYYVPSNIAICMAGDFNPDEAIAIIDKYFGSWQKGCKPVKESFKANNVITAHEDTTVVGKEGEYVTLAWKTKEAAALENDTVTLLNKVLYNGEAGLLDMDLKQKFALTETYAINYTFQEAGMMMLFAQPKEGQTLQEAKELLLGEVEKLKKGDFSDNLLTSVVNNMKLDYQKSLLSNAARVGYLVQSFISETPWDQCANQLDRISKISKADLVAFANRFFKDNYVCCYKQTGVDSTQKKIDKPQITAIPANRDLVSGFLKAFTEEEVKPISPRFLDFKKDLLVTKTHNSLPLYYKQNTDDDLFTLGFYYDFGSYSQKGLDLAADYLSYIGTDKQSAAQIKQAFYGLACSYNISVGGTFVYVILTGLNENLPQALRLYEQLLRGAKGDKKTYDNYVSVLMKSREDMKKEQRGNFNALYDYAVYGKDFVKATVMGKDELLQGTSEGFTDMLHSLADMEHRVLYFGPSDIKTLQSLLKKEHLLAKKPSKTPEKKDFMEQETPQNEVIIAPYEAKNIYMRQYHNSGRAYHEEESPVRTLFNSYFGDGMNGIVFQELRESRGLAYSAAGRYTAPNRLGHNEGFFTFIISQNDKMQDCITTFNSILDSIPASQKAFEIAKTNTMKTFQTMRQTRFSVLNSYLGATLWNRDYDVNERTYNGLQAVTLQDIIRFEKQNMSKKPCRYIILGDEKELDLNALQKIGNIKKATQEEIFGF